MSHWPMPQWLISQWVLPTLGLALLATGFVAWMIRRRVEKVWSLAPRELLSTRERAFHRLLVSKYPDHPVFAKLPLFHLMEVLQDSADRELLAKHLREHLCAFVLCRPDYRILAVIELDDDARSSSGAAARDAHTAEALQSAGLRLVRIPAGPLPEASDLPLLIEGDGFFFLSPPVRKWQPLSA